MASSTTTMVPYTQRNAMEECNRIRAEYEETPGPQKMTLKNRERHLMEQAAMRKNLALKEEEEARVALRECTDKFKALNVMLWRVTAENEQCVARSEAASDNTKAATVSRAPAQQPQHAPHAPEAASSPATWTIPAGRALRTHRTQAHHGAPSPARDTACSRPDLCARHARPRLCAGRLLHAEHGAPVA